MEDNELNLPADPSTQEPQVLYMSGDTYYTAAEGEGQGQMVTYMYDDEQGDGETQYMMIQGGESEGDLQAGGEPYVMTNADGSVQYVLVSSEMAAGGQPQFVLDQSALEGQMAIMPSVLDDQMGSEGLTGAEPIHLPEMAPGMPSEVDFLNNIEPVDANPVNPTTDTEAESDLTAAINLPSDFSGPTGSQSEAEDVGSGQTSEMPASQVEESKQEHTASSEAATTSATAQSTEGDSKTVSTVTEEGTNTEKEIKKLQVTENLTKAIRVTSVPLPSASGDSKEPKPIITVKPSAVKTLDGDRIKIETMGGVQKVFILPMNSPEKTAAKSPAKSTAAVRFISQEHISSLPVQTITLPLTTTAMAAQSPKQPRPTTATVSTLPKTPNILSPNIIKRPVGRPPLKDKLKSPQQQQQKAGPVKIRPSSSQVIVIPIQFTKDTTAPSQVNGASVKVSPSTAGAPKVKAVASTSKMAKEFKEKGEVGKDKATPQLTKKQQAEKSDDDMPSSTRRSKRGSNMSMKLAEWGLLPTGNRSTSSSDDDEMEDELEFDDEEDEVEDDFDDNESNNSMSLGIYAKSAQKGARKLASFEEKRIVTPVSTKTSVGKAPVRILSGSAPAKKTVGTSQMPEVPKEMQNKSLMCKPIMMTKATSCNPIRMTKVTQTEEDEGDVTKVVVPVPVPLFVPAPVSLFNKPAPVPIPFPVPLPVPALMPMTKTCIGNVLKQLKDYRDSLPVDPAETDILKVAEAVVTGDKEANTEEQREEETGDEESKVLIKKEDASQPVAQTAGGGGGLQLPMEVVEMALHIASQIPDDTAEVTPDGATSDSTLAGVSVDAGTGMEIANDSVSKRQFETYGIEPPFKKVCTETETLTRAATSTLRQVPVNDLHMKLKYSYGVNAWHHWVTQKNAQLDLSTGTHRRIKPFKAEILQCNAEELNFYLCLFIKEVRKPTGEEYAPDSVFYLCLGIQHYLYENGRVDCLFHDTYYSKFADALNELMSGFEVRLNAHGQIVCRVTEEHLWESRQLGAHSPHILLSTLIYFNTKHFMLNTSDGHLGLSFSNIMKQWKKNAPSSDGRPARTVYLRYNAVGPVITPSSNAADASQRRKSIEMMPYEQLENPENPMRCPVKLYEFYLSKCPESIKHRNDLFYLIPEPSCVPNSPVWYSSMPLGAEAIGKMLNRIRLVREIQESQINQLPSYYS